MLVILSSCCICKVMVRNVVILYLTKDLFRKKNEMRLISEKSSVHIFKMSKIQKA